MKLSVIIVNYNVRAYLEQCLRTVQEAMKCIEGDVFVVDNQSTDGSVEMVREKFPDVKLIANKENVGFSRANNQAIRASDAEYVVLLNPDTVVGEDVFHKVIEFMDLRPKAGGLGVKMIDGKGSFLPESKRGLPTPAVAFYKIIGLTRLFPHSRTFGRYHLGHLPEDEAAPIEILSGACMFLRKSTLNEVGLLDESFFMYGEDIDLSYRITMGGYENWYFPAAKIIHYKGESTKKSSVNYVFVFYNAMAIFAQKHFTQRRTNFFGVLINGSIYLSAAGAIVMRFLRRALLPMLDLLALFLLTVLIDHANLPKLVTMASGHGLVALGLPLLVTFGLAGAYDTPIRLGNVIKASLILGAVFLAYSFSTDLPLITRLIWSLIVALSALSIGLFNRLLLHTLRIKPFNLRTMDRTRVLAIGSEEETENALALLWQTHFGLGRQRTMRAEEVNNSNAATNIRKKIRKHGIDEVVFCSKDIGWGKIIALMEELHRSHAMFKIAQPGREFIIGPSSIESLNDLFIMPRHAVHSASGRRTKRLTDIGLAVLFGITAPVILLLVQDRGQYLRNWLAVVRGKKSWVGYGKGQEGPLKLPNIKPGVLSPIMDGGPWDALTVRRMNITYAKDYTAWRDIQAVFNSLAQLGRKEG